MDVFCVVVCSVMVGALFDLSTFKYPAVAGRLQSLTILKCGSVTENFAPLRVP